MAGIQPPADDPHRDRGGRLPRAAVRLEGRRDRGGDRAGARPEHLQLHLPTRRPAAALAAAAVPRGRHAIRPRDGRGAHPVPVLCGDLWYDHRHRERPVADLTVARRAVRPRLGHEQLSGPRIDLLGRARPVRALGREQMGHRSALSAPGRERAEGEPRLGGADLQRRGGAPEPRQPVLDAAAPRAPGRARPRPRRLRGRAAARAPAGGLVSDVALRAHAALYRACGAAVTPCGDRATKRLCRAQGGMSMTKRKGINRRQFVTTTTGVAVAAALGPTIRIKRPQKTLKILQWSHFVPSYDAWFDKYAKDWGTAKGVEVTVDHIALADLGTRANAEVAAQQGHDLFQFLSPPGAFEPQVLDMADVVKDAERQNGPILDLCKRRTYNPVTRKWFGFSDNYVPDPGDYLKTVWTEIGMPDGPVTWEDLVKAAPLIKGKHPEIQIPIGIGMSQELDSNMAARAMIWSFDGSVQDQNENVVLKSDHSLEALEFGVRLFKAGMNPSVMSWNAASNNQALNARQTGYILNSISAYRTAQDNKLPVADDIFFVPALRGPRGTRWASEHVMGIYVIWKFAQSPDVAKQCLLDLIGHYRDAVLGSKLYNFTSFPGSVADPGVAVGQKPASGNKWLEQVTANDPFGSNPPAKLKPISTAFQLATNIGHPGPANPAESEVFDTFVLPTMFSSAATDRMPAKQALEEAHQQVKKIFEKWRSRGLVAGGAGDL